MSISVFGFTLIRTRELGVIRARARGPEGSSPPLAEKGEAEEQPPTERATAGLGDEAEPPQVVRELIRLADRLPDLTGENATTTPGQAGEVARWLDARTKALLTACDVARVEDSGPLDLRRHEVVGTRAAPASDLVHHIADTVRPGYAWRGRLLRPQQIVAYTTAPETNKKPGVRHHEGI